MNKRTKVLLSLGILILILGMAFLPSIKSIFKSDNNSAPMGGTTARADLIVNATILKPQTMYNLYKTAGIFLPDEEVNLSFETSGKITNINFTEGSYVNKGTLLAKVNDEPLQAELKKLESQLPLAQDRVFRQGTLLEKDAVSQETYQTVTTALESLKADIELVKARIKQTELRAPFAGVVGLRLVSEGAYASPSLVVAKLTKISPLKLEFSVNQDQVNNVTNGTKISFTVANDLNTYNATVYAVEPQLEETTLTVKARAIYQNTDGRINPGQYASIELQLDQIENAIVIPSISSIAEMGRDIAFVYNNGKAKRLVLTKGIRTESSVQILDGLTEGDTLLTTGVMQLRDGLPVKINQINPNTAD